MEARKCLHHANDPLQVQDVLFSASYLVLGLGDVYLGAPCAVPLDPRHRLVTTKCVQLSWSESEADLADRALSQSKRGGHVSKGMWHLICHAWVYSDAQ